VSKLLYEKRDRIAYLTLNCPEAKNAIDPELHQLLWDAWEDFRDDDALDVAILTGTGDAFCAGADLKTYIPRIIERRPDGRWVRENVKTGIGVSRAGCTGSTSQSSRRTGRSSATWCRASCRTTS
jgi:enoyl-CoA hydratase/carnithine racemase